VSAWRGVRGTSRSKLIKRATLLTSLAFQVVLDNGSVKAAGLPADLRSQNVFADDELADDAEDDAHHATGSSKPDAEGHVEVSVEQQISDDPAADEAKKLQDAAKRDSKRLVKEETSASSVVDRLPRAQASLADCIRSTLHLQWRRLSRSLRALHLGHGQRLLLARALRSLPRLAGSADRG
jgi:hypothetical protein